MKKSKFTEDQIAFALKQASWVRALRRCVARWASAMRRSTCGARSTRAWPSELRRLRQPEEENRKLKQIVMHKASKVVLALGRWTRGGMRKSLGLSVPMAFERGYHMHYGTIGDVSLARPVYDIGGAYVLSLIELGLRLSTSVQIAQRDAPKNLVQLALAERAAREALPLKNALKRKPGWEAGLQYRTAVLSSVNAPGIPDCGSHSAISIPASAQPRELLVCWRR